MADEQTARDYLRDLGNLVGELAHRAKAERDETGPQASYALSRLMAFHDVVSLMQQQAVAFGMEADDVGLAGLDPERDLT